MKIKIVFFVFLLLSIRIFGLEYKYKPLKSATLSMFIPGGGQYYNDKKIKSFFVAGGEVALILKLNYDINKKNYYRKRYNASNSQADYDKFKTYYDKKQSDIFWLTFYVIMSATDAFVDAHLYNFKKEKKNVHLIFSLKKMEVSYVF